MAEHLTVDQDVVGSTPISHPKKRETFWFLFSFNAEMENRSEKFWEVQAN